MTDEEIWAVWDEVIGVNTGVDPVPFARAIEAACATSDRATALEESAAICQRLAVEALDSYTTEAGRTAAHSALICAMSEIRNFKAGSATAEQIKPVALFQFDERWKTWAQVDPNYAQDPDVIPLYSHPAEAMAVLQKLADAADIHLKGGVSSLRYAIDEARALCSGQATQQDAAIESKPAEQSLWQPIETAPEGKLLVVCWLDKEDPENPERHAFDFIEDGCWFRHNEDYDHFVCVAPPGSRGPSEDAPYTHWMLLQDVPVVESQRSGEGS